MRRATSARQSGSCAGSGESRRSPTAATGTPVVLWFPQPLGQKAPQELVIQQQNSQNQHEVIQKRVIAGRDDAQLQGRHDREQHNPKGSRKKQHPHQNEFENQREPRGPDVKPVRQVLRVPPDPGGQRAILVILIHGREMTPLRVAAGDLHDAGLEIDAEPQPLQQEKAGPRWRMPLAPTRTQARRREKHAHEASAQQHPVRLIGSKCLQGGDEGEEHKPGTPPASRAARNSAPAAGKRQFPASTKTAKRASRCQTKTASARTSSARRRRSALPPRRYAPAGCSPSGPMSPSTCRTSE